MTNGLVTHAVKDDGSGESHRVYDEFMHSSLIKILRSKTLSRHHEYQSILIAMKDFYEKVIFHHKREYGYIYGVNAYTLGGCYTVRICT